MNDSYIARVTGRFPRETGGSESIARAAAAVAEQLERPLEPRLLELYGYLAWIHGHGTTGKDVHDAWAVWRSESRPDHPDLVPFEELSPERQALDQPFVRAIHHAAWELLHSERWTPHRQHETRRVDLRRPVEEGMAGPPARDLRKLVMALWLEIDAQTLVDFAIDVRRHCTHDALDEEVERLLTALRDGERLAQDSDAAAFVAHLAAVAGELVRVAAVAAVPLALGGAARPTYTSGWEHFPWAIELCVVRLSQRHEDLRFAIAIAEGEMDPLIWSFQFEGRELTSRSRLL